MLDGYRMCLSEAKERKIVIPFLVGLHYSYMYRILRVTWYTPKSFPAITWAFGSGGLVRGKGIMLCNYVHTL
jgi:hypothetical protein